MSQSEDWLMREDTVCFADRAARLDWIAEIMPTAEYLAFPSGFMAKYLFEEARYCFVYGQFLAVIVLGLAFLEKTLAAWSHVQGTLELPQPGGLTRGAARRRSVRPLSQRVGAAACLPA